VVQALAGPARSLVSESGVTSLLTPEPALAFPLPDIAAAVERALTEVP
jgi:hypothetical protein